MTTISSSSPEHKQKPFFTVRRVVPGLVLLAMVLLPRVSILAAAPPAKVVAEYDAGLDSTCDTVVYTFAQPVDVESKPAVRLTDDKVLRIADQVIAHHRGDYWIGVYRYETQPTLAYLARDGRDQLAFWVATATVVETIEDHSYRTGNSRVTLLFIDANTGDPLLLIDQAVFSRRVDARLLAGQYRACGYFTGDVLLPSDLLYNTPAMWRLGARIISMALFGIYVVWLVATAAKTINFPWKRQGAG